MITAIFTVVSIARQFVMRRVFEALHIRRPLSAFVQAVVAERFRQIEQEGWSSDHDDLEHSPGVLAQAGAAYAIGHRSVAAHSASRGEYLVHGQELWPWDIDWWKPAERRRDLVKACALIIAEGEKFDRARKRRA